MGTDRVDPPRALTYEERGVLDFILNQNFEGREEVQAALRESKAEGTCSCGFGSIDLTIGEPPARPAWRGGKVPAEAVAKVEGYVVAAMLFVHFDDPIRGALLELVWSMDDPRDHPRLPRLEELEVPRLEPVPGVSSGWRLVNFEGDPDLRY